MNREEIERDLIALMAQHADFLDKAKRVEGAIIYLKEKQIELEKEKNERLKE